MKKKLPEENEACPVRDVMSRFGDKWSVLILLTLHENGIMRFGDIHKKIGDISHRMLTVSLRSLEADGLINRKVYPIVPPHVEYNLTEMGKSLIPPLEALVDWALHHLPAILNSRDQSEKQFANK